MSYSASVPFDNVATDLQHISEEEIIRGNWLCLPSKQLYRNMSSAQRIRKGSLDANIKAWELTNRCNKNPGNCKTDAVGALAILHRTLKYDCLVLVKRYRPALKSYTLEFPTGHPVTPDETPEYTALHELRNETGYMATAKHLSPVMSLNPCSSNTTMSIVSVEIDGDAPLNKLAAPRNSQDPETEILYIPMDELITRLNGYTEQGIMVDSKLYSFAIGLAMGIKLGKMHG